MSSRHLFVAVAAAAVVAVSLSAAPADAAQSAEDCVSVMSDAREAGMAMDVKNGCSRGLTCALTWTVECEDAGKVTARKPGASRFVVGADKTHTVVGKAACGTSEGWRFVDVGWTCAPLKK